MGTCHWAPLSLFCVRFLGPLQQERSSRTLGFLFVRVIARNPRSGLVTGRIPLRSDPLVAGYY